MNRGSLVTGRLEVMVLVVIVLVPVMSLMLSVFLFDFIAGIDVNRNENSGSQNHGVGNLIYDAVLGPDGEVANDSDNYREEQRKNTAGASSQ